MIRLAVAEALEQRWHLTVTSATIAPPTDSIVAGASLPFSFAGYSDDNTAIAFNVLWGDGSGETLNGNPSTDTHTFSDPGIYTIAATATDDGGSYMTTLQLTVSPAPFTVTPPTKFTVDPHQSAVTVGTIPGGAAKAQYFSGTIAMNYDVYGLTFTSSGADLIAEVVGLPTLSAATSYQADVSVTLSMYGVSTDASTAFSLIPLTGQNIDSPPATLGSPWTGNVAGFTDDASYNLVSDFHPVTTTYAGFAATGTDVVSSTTTSVTGSLGWNVSDTETFTVAGPVYADTYITDPANRTLDVGGSVYVDLAPISVSANAVAVGGTGAKQCGDWNAVRLRRGEFRRRVFQRDVFDAIGAGLCRHAGSRFAQRRQLQFDHQSPRLADRHAERDALCRRSRWEPDQRRVGRRIAQCFGV